MRPRHLTPPPKPARPSSRTRPPPPSPRPPIPARRLHNKKDNGLITALRHALAHPIGAYQQVIDRWGLRSETVTESRINPPGLPKKR
ncbi:hypothetical protein IU427_28540 [Nocardia beijingensis]|nr:hypothetical protein [Nocardia beijingensis]